MDSWRLIALAVMAVIIAIAYMLNHQVETMKKNAADKTAIAQKEKQLKMVTRILIAAFIVVLAAVMIQHYGKLSSLHS